MATRYGDAGNSVTTSGADGAGRLGSLQGYRQSQDNLKGGVEAQSFRNIGTPTDYAYLKMTLLETTYPTTLLHNFFNKHRLPKNKGDTMTLFRRKELEPVDSPVPEGVYPAPQSIDYEELKVKPRRYIGWAEITRDADEMGVLPVWEHTLEALGYQWGESMENICWKTMVNGRHVRFAGGVSARNAIVKEFNKTDVQSVVRDLLRRETKVITKKGRKGSSSLMDTPQLESFAGFSHIDLDATLLNMQTPQDQSKVGDFKPRVVYGGGMADAVSKYEHGQMDRVRFFLHNRLYPIKDAGGAAVAKGSASETSPWLLTSGGVNIDVYPIPIIGEKALGCIGLEGYRGGNKSTTAHPSFSNSRRGRGRPSGKLIVNRIEDTDTGDPVGLFGSAGWMDMYACFWENDNWGHCIETGVKAL